MPFGVPIAVCALLGVSLQCLCCHSVCSVHAFKAAKVLALPRAWHAGDVSALPKQGEACELAGVTCGKQAFERMHTHVTKG